MRAAIALALMLALPACGGEESPAQRIKRDAAESVAQQETKAQAAAAGMVAPESAPASYAAFPEEVRLTIYRADLLAQKCQGRFRGNRQAACAEREALAKGLLAKGWCFGGADDPASQHWLPCAEDYPGGESWIASPKEGPPTGQ
ncbi:hypothetical protein OF829_17905 [Sphingomonas sp. LB-2]|uniref:hypothetical protein n=1 Tax=Sphingomonas caeni TaxID=2984949 RepID=UPI0022309A04|nr:hypothetical protein [Sphingomonas caeni]MCW3849118.1 hypothetical protein [Sphingomonas caeni]